MKFALLGVDDTTAALARFLATQPAHAITAVYGVEADAPWLAALSPTTQPADSWEALLHDPLADAVIVASGPAEERAEQLGKLVRASVPLLVCSPTCDVVTAYELEMIRRDTQAPLVPLIPGRLHPAILRLLELVNQGEQGPLGQIEQAVVERSLVQRGREPVLRQFTRDVSLLRALAGEVHRVSAMGPQSRSSSWNNLNVQMITGHGAILRWTAQPADSDDLGKLIVVGSRRKAVLDMLSRDLWTLTVRGSETLTETFESADELACVLDAFQSALQGDPYSPRWQDACRDIEIAATAERSLARGRTVEMYEEEISEEATFKGIMAVGGCAMLLLGLTAFLIAAVVEGLQLPFRNHVLWQLWPVYLLVPIVFFLLLQFLQLVFRDRPKSPAPESKTPSSTA
jgi:predicted dehydrogenase